jgi:hypothetical protein
MTELSEQEQAICSHVADLVEARLDSKYRRVVQALAIVSVIVVVGCLAGWMFIERSRYQSWFDDCREINARNTNARNTLRSLNAPARRALDTVEVRALITDLAPYRTDCAAYAREKVR